MKQNLLYILLLFFVFITGILGATVYFNRQKIFLEDKNPVITEAPKEEKKTQEPTPTNKKERPPTTTPTPGEFANWITYQNDKFKYRLRYDPSWLKTRDCDTANNCSFQGDISTRGWPDISVGKRIFPGIGDLDALKTHLEGTYPEVEVKKVVFSQQEIPAVYLSFPRSPQAYASEEYYFFHKGEILSISLNDSDNASAQRIYNYFLLNFELIND